MIPPPPALSPSSCRIGDLCSPDGPGTPFATPYLMLCDGARVLCVVASLIIVLRVPVVLFRCWMPAQRARVIGFGALILQVMETEAEHFGDLGSVRLLLNTVGALLGVYGLIRFEQSTARHRRAR